MLFKQFISTTFVTPVIARISSCAFVSGSLSILMLGCGSSPSSQSYVPYSPSDYQPTPAPVTPTYNSPDQSGSSSAVAATPTPPVDDDPVGPIDPAETASNNSLANSTAFQKAKMKQITDDYAAQQDPAARKQLMVEYLKASGPYARQHQSDIDVWRLRAAAAVEADDARAGWGAGCVLKALGPDKMNDQVTQVLVALDRKGWLLDSFSTVRKARALAKLTEGQRSMLGKWTLTGIHPFEDNRWSNGRSLNGSLQVEIDDTGSFTVSGTCGYVADCTNPGRVDTMQHSDEIEKGTTRLTSDASSATLQICIHSSGDTPARNASSCCESPTAFLALLISSPITDEMMVFDWFPVFQVYLECGHRE